MKVGELRHLLKDLPDSADVCALIWLKESFDYEPDDESILTYAGWESVCREFDAWDSAGEVVGEWIADAVSDRAVPNEPTSNVVDLDSYRG